MNKHIEVPENFKEISKVVTLDHMFYDDLYRIRVEVLFVYDAEPANRKLIDTLLIDAGGCRPAPTTPQMRELANDWMRSAGCDAVMAAAAKQNAPRDAHEEETGQEPASNFSESRAHVAGSGPSPRQRRKQRRKSPSPHPHNLMHLKEKMLQHPRRSEAPPKDDQGTKQRKKGKEGITYVGGVPKRVTTMEDLQRRFAVLDAPGVPSVYISRLDFLPIQDADLKRRLEGEVAQTGEKDGQPIHVPAYKYWTGNAHRHVYRSVAFTSRPISGDVYNLYRGLGVTPRAGKCDLILQHIREVICSGELERFEAMINLLAWQIQNIGKPSRIVVVLHNPKQQAGGKGMLLEEIMLKIYGPSGFSPATVDQVLGRFNDTIRGRAYIFLDEVLFAGDLRAADAVKALSTTTMKGIETRASRLSNARSP